MFTEMLTKVLTKKGFHNITLLEGIMDKLNEFVLQGINFPKIIGKHNQINVPLLNDIYGLNNEEFTSIIKKSKQQANRIFNNAKYKPSNINIKNILDDLVKILTLILYSLDISTTQNLDDDTKEKIANWFRLPNPAFKNKSPYQLVTEGDSYDVIKSLEFNLYGVPS